MVLKSKLMDNIKTAEEIYKKYLGGSRLPDYLIKNILAALEEYKSQPVESNWQAILKIMLDTHEEFPPNGPVDHEQSELYMYMAKRIEKQFPQPVSNVNDKKFIVAEIMKINDIVEGNRLIAKFMGAEKSKIDGDSRYLRFQTTQAGTETFAFYPKDLKYHTSWDWLMPVVEKIEAMGKAVTIQEMFCDIDSRDELSATASSKIEAVWLAVIEFIKFNNQNKEQ